MKFINAKVHGILDYATVALFVLAPSLVPLSELAVIISYTLAVVHLTMTILTDFSMGLFKVIPLKLHGYVEFVVGIAIPLMPFVLGFDGIDFYFYLVVGISIFIVGHVTDYKEEHQIGIGGQQEL